MENNGYRPIDQKGSSTQNGAVATADNVVTFPSNDDTNLKDISRLLGDTPVLQKEQPANRTPANNDAIASQADFEAAQETKPLAHRLGPKTIAGAVLSGLIILPVSMFFIGGGSNQSEQTAVETGPTGEESNGYVSPEDYAAMQSELEQLRSQQAFIDQQVDAEAIDAMGKQKAAAAQTAKPPTKAATKPTTTPTAKPSAVTARRPAPAPAPSRVITPAPRSAPSAAAQPTRIIQASTPTAEPVDPFARRAQLQAMGTYGAPPPMAQSTRTVQANNSFESANPFIQAIAVETTQPEPSFSVARAAPERPLTEEELAYQQDASAVLETAPPEAVEIEATEQPAAEPSVGDSAVIDLRSRMTQPPEETAQEVARTSSPQTTSSAMAIMPGTSAQAELPYGFSWQEGTAPPEILLSTTEDIMAGDRAIIPSGTQFLGQAQIDPNSGAVNIQVVGIFGETQDIQIPSAAVAVRAADGGVLTAKANGGPSRGSGPNIGGFLMESLGNGLGNVLSNGDSVLEDVGGGVAETIIDDQMQRSQNRTATQNSRAAAQPLVWTLNEQQVQLTFNSYIPLDNASR